MDVTESDLEAMRCTERLIEAMQNLRLLLERREKGMRASLRVTRPTSDYLRSLKAAAITEEREDLNEALLLFEQRRRESRIATFRSALDHGVSINELGRIWGFSRQMASRYAKEARGEEC